MSYRLGHALSSEGRGTLEGPSRLPWVCVICVLRPISLSWPCRATRTHLCETKALSVFGGVPGRPCPHSLLLVQGLWHQIRPPPGAEVFIVGLVKQDVVGEMAIAGLSSS